MKIKTLLAIAAAAALMQSCASDPGAIPGDFSISETQKVKFSQGNLQYQPSTSTFKFADNQWDIIGESNASLADGYDGWIDLFAFGSGDNAAATEAAEGKQWSEFGSNAISNGGAKPNMWRTLSTDEWMYLLTKRPDAMAKFSLAKVCGVPGMMLLPDNFEASSDMKFVPFASDSLYASNRGIQLKGASLFYRYGQNEYTAEQWAPFQAKGAVFVPCCGNVTSVRYSYQNDFPTGNLWVSNKEENGFAKSIMISTHSIDANFGMSIKVFRCGIRLVKDSAAK